MAFVSQGWFLDTTWIDTGGNTTTRRFFLTATDNAGDISPVIAAVQDVVEAYVAATGAVLTKQVVGQINVEDSVTLPTGNVNIEDNLQVSAKVFGTPNKSAVFEIPAPKDTLFIAPTGPGHNVADFADPLLAAVVNLYVDGGQLYISDGETITNQNIRGKRVHHKSTKG